MSDGSNLGVTARRALDTILGGDPSPTEDEIQTPEQVSARIMNAPSPLEGGHVFETYGEDGYAVAADAIAKAFLLVALDDPDILDRPVYWGPENTEIEDLWGKQASSPETAVWDKVCAQWPGFDEWLGGASGFMVSFAYNTVKYIIGQEVTGNSAIVEINV